MLLYIFLSTYPFISGFFLAVLSNIKSEDPELWADLDRWGKILVFFLLFVPLVNHALFLILIAKAITERK